MGAGRHFLSVGKITVFFTGVSLPLAQSDFYTQIVALEAKVLAKNFRNLGKKCFMDYFKFNETMNCADARPWP
jgi:hypothetical protein